MEQEEKKLLQETFELAKENNKMLRKVRGVQKRQAIFSTLKWVIIIGISIGAFYFLQPFVGQMKKFIQDSGVSLDQLKNLGNAFGGNTPNPQDLQKELQKFQNSPR